MIDRQADAVQWIRARGCPAEATERARAGRLFAFLPYRIYHAALSPSHLGYMGTRRPVGKGIAMALYMLQATYTPEAWAAQIRNPQNRVDLVRPVVESMGGSIEHTWYAFGEYDIVAIVQMPDNVTAAAFSLAINAGGAHKAVKTTPLMTIEDGVQAMQKAGSLNYQPPR